MKLCIIIESDAPKNGPMDELEKYLKKLEKIHQTIVETLKKKHGLKVTQGGTNYFVVSTEGPERF